MKEKIIIALIVLVSTIKAQDTTNSINPHGGILKTIQNYKIEVVESYGCVSVYVYDATLKSISNRGITGEILFVYDNDASLNAKLKPVGNDGFIAEVLNSNYYYYTVHLKIHGKIIKSKFDNISGLADTDAHKIVPSK